LDVVRNIEATVNKIIENFYSLKLQKNRFKAETRKITRVSV